MPIIATVKFRMRPCAGRSRSVRITSGLRKAAGTVMTSVIGSRQKGNCWRRQSRNGSSDPMLVRGNEPPSRIKQGIQIHSQPENLKNMKTAKQLLETYLAAISAG